MEPSVDEADEGGVHEVAGGADSVGGGGPRPKRLRGEVLETLTVADRAQVCRGRQEVKVCSFKAQDHARSVVAFLTR